MSSVHAHKLLEKIAFAESQLPLSEWKRIAADEFGADITFVNCGGLEMNIEQVFDFFQQKRKIIVALDGTVQPNHDNICSGHH